MVNEFKIWQYPCLKYFFVAVIKFPNAFTCSFVVSLIFGYSNNCSAFLVALRYSLCCVLDDWVFSYKRNRQSVNKWTGYIFIRKPE